MSRSLAARGSGGALLLTKRLLPISSAANHIHSATTRPSLLLPPTTTVLPPISQSMQTRTGLSWTQWLSIYPTSTDELQTIYKACHDSHAFADTTAPTTSSSSSTTTKQQQQIPDAEFAQHTFEATPGLQKADWDARGIHFAHAAAVAQRLWHKKVFAPAGGEHINIDKNNKAAKALFARWPAAWEKAQAAAGFELARAAVLRGEAAAAAKNDDAEGKQQQQQQQQKQQEEREPRSSSVLTQERKLAMAARAVLRARKRAELASDAAEGIKSVRRPLRINAHSREGVPLVFASAEQLRRLERGKREIVVEKQPVGKKTTATAADGVAGQVRDARRGKPRVRRESLERSHRGMGVERGRERGARESTEQTMPSRKGSRSKVKVSESQE
ncbi:unnamed protein product [Discula destructiva]